MHELSIITNVFNIVTEISEKEQLKKVTRVNLEVGKLNQVVPEMMQFAFETITKSTPSENAVLNIIEIPVTLKCRSCGHVFSIDDNIFICPGCMGSDLEMTAGKELTIKSIEGEK